MREAFNTVERAYILIVKEAGYVQYEAYFQERLATIEAAIEAQNP